MSAVSPALAPLSLTEALAESFAISPETWVSHRSQYKDPKWDFRQPGKVRSDSVPGARMVIDWHMYSMPVESRKFSKGVRVIGHLGAYIPEGMVLELQALAYLSLKMKPDVFGSRGKQSSKPNTVIPSIRSVICLLADIYASYEKMVEGHLGPPLICSICDISLEDLMEAMAASSRTDGAKLSNYLARLANPVMARFLPRPLEWNKHDLKELDFKKPPKREDYSPVLHDELFRLVSDTACADVKGFLELLHIEPSDKHEGPKKPTFSQQAGPMLWEHYVEIRHIDRETRQRTGKRTDNASHAERRQLERWFGVTPEVFQLYLSRVQRAAFTLIGLYTGGRYSDLTSFRGDCVAERYGMPVLLGTEVKRRPIDAPEDEDIWPAIPIMLDAIRCLQEISRVTFNPYLVSATYTVGVDEEPYPLSYTGFINAMNLYVEELDVSGRWERWRISANSLRHTLAYNLGRLGVNPVYISVQLKHLDDASRLYPADVTLGYGDQGQLAMLRAMGAEKASLEVVKEIFSSHARIAGGGKEAHLARRKAFFAGMEARGYTEEQILEMLARSGMPFVSVGGGFCGGKRAIPRKDGTLELPPCLGQLQCNPADCHQAIITERHIPHWQGIHFHNSKRVDDPRMAHAKAHFQAAADKALKVLDDLGAAPV